MISSAEAWPFCLDGVRGGEMIIEVCASSRRSIDGWLVEKPVGLRVLRDIEPELILLAKTET